MEVLDNKDDDDELKRGEEELRKEARKGADDNGDDDKEKDDQELEKNAIRRVDSYADDEREKEDLVRFAK